MHGSRRSSHFYSRSTGCNLGSARRANEGGRLAAGTASIYSPRYGDRGETCSGTCGSHRSVRGGHSIRGEVRWATCFPSAARIGGRRFGRGGRTTRGTKATNRSSVKGALAIMRGGVGRAGPAPVSTAGNSTSRTGVARPARSSVTHQAATASGSSRAFRAAISGERSGPRRLGRASPAAIIWAAARPLGARPGDGFSRSGTGIFAQANG